MQASPLLARSQKPHSPLEHSTKLGGGVTWFRVPWCWGADGCWGVAEPYELAMPYWEGEP